MLTLASCVAGRPQDRRSKQRSVMDMDRRMGGHYTRSPMQAVQPHSLLVPILLGAFIVWRFYSRIRRMVMRQKLSKVRPWITVCVFPILLVLFALASLAHPLPLVALAGGVAAGIGLGTLGLRLTKFETTPEGMFYTPNAHLGIALSALLIGRIA